MVNFTYWPFYPWGKDAWLDGFQSRYGRFGEELLLPLGWGWGGGELNPTYNSNTTGISTALEMIPHKVWLILCHKMAISLPWRHTAYFSSAGFILKHLGSGPQPLCWHSHLVNIDGFYPLHSNAKAAASHSGPRRNRRGKENKRNVAEPTPCKQGVQECSSSYVWCDAGWSWWGIGQNLSVLWPQAVKYKGPPPTVLNFRCSSFSCLWKGMYKMLQCVDKYIFIKY